MEGWGKGEEVRGVEQRKRRKKYRQTDRQTGSDIQMASQVRERR